MLAIATLSGCASVTRSYDDELKNTLQQSKSGNIDQALATLESNNPDADKDLLYFLEKGELTRLQNNYSASREALLQADTKIQVWEAEAKNNPEQIMGLVGSVLINDKVMRYDGQDYEKVMASTKLALTHIALGDMNAARIEIKKTHEREAVIQEFRDKEYAAVETEAKEKGQQTTFKDLQGYPVETLNDPEVTSLKNGYQNAFSHYLSGFVYEAINEPGLAAAGYRTAIELRPGLPFLEEGLAGLGKRGIQADVKTSKKSKKKRNKDADDSSLMDGSGGTADVLFVIETGSIAGRQSVSIPLPIPTSGGVVLAPITFPVIRGDSKLASPTSIQVDATTLAPTKVANLDAMAQRCLSDDMPGIIVRSTIRAAVKGTLQKEAGRLGLAGQLVAMAATVATEGADERSWRSLPKDIYLARAPVSVGRHDIMLDGQRVSVEIKPGANVVNLRQMGGKLYLVQPNTPFIPPAPMKAPASAPNANEPAPAEPAANKESAE
jgi:hypothetical protein